MTLEDVNSVYKLKCKICPAVYIGESKRPLFHRMNEHKKDIEHKRDKAVANHCINNHDIDWKKISIPDREPNLHKRRISEMLYIQLENDAINDKKDKQFLNNNYKTLMHIISNLN